MPLAFGLGLSVDEEVGTPLILLGQLVVWGSAFVSAFLFWDDFVDWVQPFLNVNMFLIGFGGIFMLVGAAVTSFTIRDDVLFGLMFGGVFMLGGGILFAIGVWSLLKGIA